MTPFRCALALALTAISANAVSAQALMIGAQGPMLHSGTEVSTRTVKELTTQGKTLKVGDRFDVETVDALSLNGQAVIPAGTHGVGEITAVRNKGMWGKSGAIEARLLYLQAGGRQIRLNGSTSDKGKAGGAGAAAVSALVFLPAGFFMTGTSARIPAGSVIRGYLAEDVPVAFAGDRSQMVNAAGAAAAGQMGAAPAGAPPVAVASTPN